MAHQTKSLNIEIKFTAHNLTYGGLFSSRNAKNTRIDQSLLLVYLLYPKRKHSQAFKNRSFKKCFLHCVCFLASMNLFISRDDWKKLLFIKVYRYYSVFSSAMLLLSLKYILWKKSVFYVISIRILVTPYSKIKLS